MVEILSLKQWISAWRSMEECRGHQVESLSVLLEKYTSPLSHYEPDKIHQAFIFMAHHSTRMPTVKQIETILTSTPVDFFGELQ